jgi:uncharacterized membrane protein
MNKVLSFLALVFIVIGLMLMVLGHASVQENGLDEQDVPEEPEQPDVPDVPDVPDEPDAPEEPEQPPDGPPFGGPGGDPLKPVDIFGFQVSKMEIIGFLLILMGFVLLFLRW